MYISPKHLAIEAEFKKLPQKVRISEVYKALCRVGKIRDSAVKTRLSALELFGALPRPDEEDERDDKPRREPPRKKKPAREEREREWERDEKRAREKEDRDIDENEDEDEYDPVEDDERENGEG